MGARRSRQRGQRRAGRRRRVVERKTIRAACATDAPARGAAWRGGREDDGGRRRAGRRWREAGVACHSGRALWRAMCTAEAVASSMPWARRRGARRGRRASVEGRVTTEQPVSFVEGGCAGVEGQGGGGYRKPERRAGTWRRLRSTPSPMRYIGGAFSTGQCLRPVLKWRRRRLVPCGNTARY